MPDIDTQNKDMTLVEKGVKGFTLTRSDYLRTFVPLGFRFLTSSPSPLPSPSSPSLSSSSSSSFSSSLSSFPSSFSSRELEISANLRDKEVSGLANPRYLIDSDAVLIAVDNEDSCYLQYPPHSLANCPRLTGSHDGGAILIPSVIACSRWIPSTARRRCQKMTERPYPNGPAVLGTAAKAIPSVSQHSKPANGRPQLSLSNVR
ncbi:hypothetical protein GGR57DRAFT_52947 [Xylariaceae sp. FL1272]|nr:hypothetical protein GGR57DRAFT_52947 [Xylariaceae sp. FL1272]